MKRKITLQIDGKPYWALEGQTVIEVARDHGLEIPSLCYYPHIEPPLGTCRVCTVMANGRPVAACTEKVKGGMEVEVHSEALNDLRRAVLEMMFAEGNHFCPACEKSGDCDLQGLAGRMGIRAARFPHLFVDRLIDYRPQRLVIEHNRCIRCRRCVEEVNTKEGKRVFSFGYRGNRTVVMVDYVEEAQLTDEEALEAMHICPTGAILYRGQSLARPRGERKYDLLPDMRLEKRPGKFQTEAVAGKKVIATTSLAGCFGCHMSMLDIDEEVAELLEVLEINRSPLVDRKRFSRRCDIGLIEGGCCNEENVEVLRDFRKNCDVLVSVGECAIWGGLPAMRNTLSLEACLLETYGERESIPHSEELPPILDRVYPCNEVVQIDYYIPGCPPDPDHIWKVVRHVLFGEPLEIYRREIKYD